MRHLGFIIAGWFVASGVADAQEWTRFRGPNGQGVSELRFPLQWSDEQFHWTTDLPGVGHSSPVLWKDRLFITSADEATGKRMVICLHAPSGRQLWLREYEAKKSGKHSLNSFASPTPTVDEHRVYHCFATADDFLVIALTHDGDELWRRDLGPFRSGHGFGASPILVDGALIVPNEQAGQSSLVALEVDDGAIRWQIERKSQVHFYTPCVLQRSDRTDVVFTNWEQGITGLDPRTGETRWSADVFNKDHIESSIGSPIVVGDLVLGVCGWLGHGNEVVAVRPPEDAGTSQAEKVYRIDRGAPLCTTPVVKGDLLFLWADNGTVACADVRTGKLHWQKRVGGVFYSSPVALAEHVFNISTEGEVIFLAADKEFHIAARTRLDEGSHATPAIADGVMYIRTFSRLHAMRSEQE